MIQKAIVKKVLGDGVAEIEVTRESACGGNCASCKGCAMPTERVSAIAKNPLGANLGETVTVEGGTSKILGMAVVVYIVPFILFFLFYAISASIEYLSSFAAGFGILGFVVGILIAMVYNKLVKNKNEIIFTIVSLK